MPDAHLIHRLPGRLRMRLPDQRKDQAFLDDLASRMSMHEGIERVTCDAVTGSLLIRHSLDDATLDRILEQQFDLALAPAPVPTVHNGLAPLNATMNAVDYGLRRATGGSTDLRVVLFLLLMGLAVRQMLRGQVMVPAVTLLWQAFEVAMRLPADD